MALSSDFESQLQEIVQAKRLSGSKITKLTELAMKSMQDDTNMVSILYRTHKSLSTTSKISSLYVFDALARAAKSKATKRDLSPHSPTGNCATFLSKVEAILDGLFQDMLASSNQDCRDKSKKILDIWIKGKTFPEATLSHLTKMFNRKEPENAVTPSDPRIAAAPQKSPPPPSLRPPTHSPVQIPTPLVTSQATTIPVPTNDANTLITLLQQAAAGQNTSTQSTASSSLTAQQILLQQLAQVAQTQKATTSTPAANIPASTADFANLTNLPGPNGHWEAGSSHSPPSFRDVNQQRSPRAVNGNDRGPTRDPRTNLRGRGFDGSRDDRERLRGRQQSPLHTRPRDGRSKSPPSRYGGRRDVKPYSPPRRPSMSTLASAESRNNTEISGSGQRDEFGRDVRHASPSSKEGNNTPMHVQPTIALAANAMAAQSPPHGSIAGPSSAIVASSSLPGSTSTLDISVGLEQFVPHLFNPTLPDSWMALGKMWEVTNHYVPSQEELMQYYLAMMMMGGGVPVQQAVVAPETSTPWQDRGGHAGRGAGRGAFTAGRGAFNSQNHWNQGAGQDFQSDATVLGGEEPSAPPEEENTGGGMQRVGDKWMFVKKS